MARNPSRIGRYDLITAIATGGMGRIYLGRATGIGGFERKVVIKTLEIPLTPEADPAVAMFLDEARLLGLLHHQHIAGVFEVGQDDDGRHFMVLEYLEGHSAHDLWERAIQFGAALPLDFTLTVISAAASGLHYAHTRKGIDGSPLGIVHRDVTPSNVMIGYDGAVRLIDFGIAMATQRTTKTQTGFVKGKVGYLSPEQVAGRDVDPRTDVFALGILLYELSTLHRAFRDSSDLATMQRIKAGKVVRPTLLVRDYPLELEAIVMKALQVDPRDRFPDADGLRRAIEALGHRVRLVLGDAAVMEVMSQLFDPQATAKDEPASRMSDPAFEWLDSDHDLTVRRDPAELLAVMRGEAPPTSTAAEPPRQIEARPRKLRTATETAEAAVVPSPGGGPLSGAALPLASPPPTSPAIARPTGKTVPPPPPRPATASAAPAVASASTVAAPGPRKSTAMGAAAPLPTPVPVVPSLMETPPIGHTVVQAHKRRRSTLPWIAGLALVGTAGAIVYIATKQSPSAAAGSATPGSAAPAAPPAFARTPVPPAPPKPAHTEPPPPPPPPPKPTEVRVRIVTRPTDATVLLDGKRVGHTPFDETLAADTGNHVIKLRRRGYTVHRLDVTLEADITEEIALTPGK